MKVFKHIYVKISTMIKSNELIYQIFPRNYSKEGKITNITADLDRLKSINVDIIYLLPINPIGKKNRKGTWGSPYASEDYFGVSSDLGTIEDVQELCQKAHQKGMKIILDMVFNHTAPDSALFKEHPEYYYYKNGKPGNRVGDWSDIIDLDTSRDDTQAYLISVLQYWIKQGFDGFRFDVASMIPLSFFKKARQVLGPEVIFLAESVDPGFITWLLSQGHYATEDEDMVPNFDCLYNYHWFRSFISYLHGEKPLMDTIDILNTPTHVRRVNCLENHDNDRINEVIKGNAILHHNLLAFSVFLNGDVFLYMGEEYGNRHKPDLFEKDPVDFSLKNEEIFTFINKLIKYKHEEKDNYLTPYKVIPLSEDALMISRSDEIGILNFSKKPLTYVLPNGEYLDLLTREIIKGGKMTIIEPLLLKRL